MDSSEQKKHHSSEDKANSPSKDLPTSVPARAEKISASASKHEEDTEEELDEFSDDTSFLEKLHGLRIGRSLFSCLLAIILIGGIVFALFFGGWNRIRPYIPFLSSSTVAPTFSPEKIHLNVYDTRTAFHFGFYKNNPGKFDPPSLEIAFIFGGIKRSLFFTIPPTQSGIAASYIFGFRGQSLQRLEVYVQNIFQIQNILNTDIAALLDAQKDRKPVLDALIESFDNLIKVSQENAAFVTKEVITMRELDNSLRSQLAAKEKQFTSSLSQFLPQDSSKQLDEYTKLAKEESEMKAQLGAMAKIDKYYQVGMVKLLARIRDIKANQDALIKGVKVFDIKNSDLKIIEYEGKSPVDPAINAIDRSKSSSAGSGGSLTPLNMFPQ